MREGVWTFASYRPLRRLCFRTVPALVVSVFRSRTAGKRSPSTSGFGVREYWIVDSETEMVQSFRLSGGNYPVPVKFRKNVCLVSALLPGLSIPLSDVLSS
ncbi:MAG: hypothetical protein ACYCTV_07020 [Leptospirales bacterium]